MGQAIARLSSALPVLLGMALVCVNPVAAQETRPRFRDPKFVNEMMFNSYPPDLRLLGIGGTVVVEVLVDTDGSVDSVVVASSSGIPSLDASARFAAYNIQFTEVAAPMWVQLPLGFQSDAAAVTPFASLPRPLDRRKAQQTAKSLVPAQTREGDIGAVVLVAVHVDSAGNALTPRVAVTSCMPEYDEAARAAAGSLRFAPADSTSGPAPRFSIATFTFNEDSVHVSMPGETREPANPDSILRYAVPPKLVNRNEVGRAFARFYPPDLRDRGVGGIVQLWLFIDDVGAVKRRMIKRTSGECRFDLAALVIANRMKFEPAIHDGKLVKLWVELPIVFRTQ